MNKRVLMYIFFIIINSKSSLSRNYVNYTLYNLYPVERYQLEFLQNLEKLKYMNVIFWIRPFRLHNDIQILVSPNDLQIFCERLQHYNLKGTVLSKNIQSLFDKQNIYSYTRTKLETFSWQAYHSLESIYQWMTDIGIQYSEKLNLTTVGNSAEGREILAIEFLNPKAKANVFVEAAIHGNEWITTEFVTYLIYHIANAEKSDNSRLKQLAKKFRWIIIPVANPDGYAYSMKHDRLWRKNRRNLGNNYFGVDLNKNFNYSFCKHGGNTNPKHDNYCGPSFFSEPESLAISKFVDKCKDRLNFYFAFHSYGQKIILPYSDRVKHLENFSEMENYGKQAILKMYKLHGVKYGIGTIYDIYGYRSAGDSVSWVKNTYKLKYALTFYLRDNGTYGYALPSEQILPACKEMLVGLVELMSVRHRQVARDLFSSATSLKPTYVALLVLKLNLY